MAKKPRPTDKNLQPVATKEQARERGRAGGLASARARAEKKSIKESLEILMKMPVKDGPVTTIAGADSLNKDSLAKVNPTSGELLALATLQKALKGDMKAMRIIMELTDEGQQVQQVSPLDRLADTIAQYKDEDDDD